MSRGIGSHVCKSPREGVIANAASFLCDRLDDLRHVLGEDEDTIYREFEGHVSPALARLRSALDALNAQPAASDGGEG